MAQLLHVIETEVAVLRHGLFETGARIPQHRHDRPSLVYGFGGPCVERNGTAQVVRRRLTFLPDDYEHALEYQGSTHVLVIEIAKDWLRQTGRGRIPVELTPLPATLYDLVWRAMLDVAVRAPPEALSASLQALVEAAIDYTLKPPSPLAVTLIDELHQHWKEVPSVDQLSRKYSLSKQYICRIFKKAMGITLQQYGLIVRLDHARGLLWGTDSSIADVAADTGFADQSHLTRALTAHSALTPLRLRGLAPCREIPSAIEARISVPRPINSNRR